MSLRPSARCHRRSIQKEAIPRPKMRTKNAIAPTTIRPTRPLKRRWAGGRGISDSGRIASEATRQRERVRIDIQDVRGDLQRRFENGHPRQPCQPGCCPRARRKNDRYHRPPISPRCLRQLPLSCLVGSGHCGKQRRLDAFTFHFSVCRSYRLDNRTLIITMVFNCLHNLPTDE